MLSDTPRISHVSDTALMTTACRALETERPDGWVSDPLAARLAGDRGMAIARNLPAGEIMCFGVGMRTRILDDAITTAISAHGIAVVLSLGAGLDTRPWRLDLPAALRWVEMDLPPLLEYKEDILAAETPKCRLQRQSVDLNDPDQRRAAFQTAGEGPAMMISEGLLMYLPASTVEALAREAIETAGIRYWMLDIATGALSRAIRMQSYQDVEAVRASGCLDGEGILDVARRSGWEVIDSRTYATAGMKSIPPARLASLARHDGPAPPPPPATDLSGVHLLGRSTR